ncbi:hypothetical protein GF367_04095, partial [Candidatus Woesearchaeota archaeon]|nr:hypothetical protein [Candidatus Woesearchaeota archaeon]
MAAHNPLKTTGCFNKKTMDLYEDLIAHVKATRPDKDALAKQKVQLC